MSVRRLWALAEEIDGLKKEVKEAEARGFKNGLRHAADIAKRQYLKNKDKAPTVYHNCDSHECYGCRADEAITIQTLLETEVNRKGGVRDE